jgi:hypothetical protein
MPTMQCDPLRCYALSRMASRLRFQSSSTEPLQNPRSFDSVGSSGYHLSAVMAERLKSGWGENLQLIGLSTEDMD